MVQKPWLDSRWSRLAQRLQNIRGVLVVGCQQHSFGEQGSSAHPTEGGVVQVVAGAWFGTLGT